MKKIFNNLLCGCAYRLFRRQTAALPKSGEIPGEDVDAQVGGQKLVELLEEGDVVGVAVGVDDSQVGGGNVACAHSRNPPTVNRDRVSIERISFHRNSEKHVFEGHRAALIEEVKAVFEFVFGNGFIRLVRRCSD